MRLQRGFTLVEMLVVAPIIIVTISAFIAVIVNMTGEVLSSRGSNSLAYDVQDTLNRIEQDIKLSTTFLAVNNISFSATNPQGFGAHGSTTNFTNIGGASGTSLILNSIVTNGNPVTAGTGMIYLRDAPNSCSSATSYVRNTPLSMNIIYYIDDQGDSNPLNDTLWRRTVMPTNYTPTSGLCGGTPWQQPSCKPGYSSSFCRTNDVKLLEGVTMNDFIVQYYTSASVTAPNTVASTSTDSVQRADALRGTQTASVSITARKSVAGRDIERSGTIRATRLDTNATALGVVNMPTSLTAPEVNLSVEDGDNVKIVWPQVQNATSYMLSYRVNGGSWIQLTADPGVNNNNRTMTLDSATIRHDDLIDVQISAVNAAASIGSSATTASVRIPVWSELTLGNNWNDYGGVYAPAGFTKTRAGVVVLKGLLKRVGTPVAWEVIGKLPPGYRPEGILVFPNITNPNISGRVDVYPNGDVVVAAADPGYYSLDNIRFVPNNPDYTRTYVTPVAGWTNYDATVYAGASHTMDNEGRVWLQGLIRPGTVTDGTMILPSFAGFLAPSQHRLFTTRGGAGAWMDLLSTGQYRIRNVNPSGYMTINSMWYPAVNDNWTNVVAPTLTNGWGRYDASTSGYAWPAYTKGSDNLVTLKGMVSGGSATSDTAILTLPACARPAERLLMVTTSNSAVARVDILNNGQVRFMTGSNAWFSLDNITFVASSTAAC